MRVLFLHIPKTAGQSVHAALEYAFGKENICPARVNDQLLTYSVSDLSRYQVFSGHLDWSLLDCVPGPTYRFTILRDPMDRILSFYFYLRGKAENMSREELSKPYNLGLRAALEMSPDDYFLGGDQGLRRFLDNHYDNFFTYYFAARRYSGRADLAGLIRRGELSEKQVLDMAFSNLDVLDDVFTIDRIEMVFARLAELSGKNELVNKINRVNVNTDVQAQERESRLRELGAGQATMERIEAYCRMDKPLWDKYS